jgi:hypothetical protein
MSIFSFHKPPFHNPSWHCLHPLITFQVNLYFQLYLLPSSNFCRLIPFQGQHWVLFSCSCWFSLGLLYRFTSEPSFLHASHSVC